MTEEKSKKNTGSLIGYILLGILGVGVLVALLLPARECAREAARRACCTNNLSQIGRGLQNFHSAKGHFPPAYTVDEAGKPLHSWRTLILPYMEEGKLYEKIKLDEPWDSPHNLAVYENLPMYMYQCPSSPLDDSVDTNYVMVLGPDCISNGPNSCTDKDITKGTSNTAYLIETLVPIRWYEPRDLRADEINFKFNDETQPGIGSGHPGVVLTLFCDGSVQSLVKNIDPEELRAMFEIKEKAAKTPPPKETLKNP